VQALFNRFKLPSGQDKFTSDIDTMIAVLKWTSDIAVLEWIVDTVWSLTVAQHPKFRMMMHLLKAISTQNGCINISVMEGNCAAQPPRRQRRKTPFSCPAAAPRLAADVLCSSSGSHPSK
jgi:hypothetical protein